MKNKTMCILAVISMLATGCASESKTVSQTSMGSSDPAESQVTSDTAGHGNEPADNLENLDNTLDYSHTNFESQY